jgi:hypothetical protein
MFALDLKQPCSMYLCVARWIGSKHDRVGDGGDILSQVVEQPLQKNTSRPKAAHGQEEKPGKVPDALRRTEA